MRAASGIAFSFIACALLVLAVSRPLSAYDMKRRTTCGISFGLVLPDHNFTVINDSPEVYSTERVAALLLMVDYYEGEEKNFELGFCVFKWSKIVTSSRIDTGLGTGASMQEAVNSTPLLFMGKYDIELDRDTNLFIKGGAGISFNGVKLDVSSTDPKVLIAGRNDAVFSGALLGTAGVEFFFSSFGVLTVEAGYYSACVEDIKGPLLIVGFKVTM